MVQVLDTLAEINERHEAVKELEKGLMELHQIFLDMAVLVEAQGEMLDNIEQQVSLMSKPICLIPHQNALTPVRYCAVWSETHSDQLTTYGRPGFQKLQAG